MTTEAIRWEIPPSVLRWLERAPTDRPVAMLIRHSVRDHLPPGDAGYRLPITEVGVRLARALGARLGARLRTLRASPLVRCVQTAEALAEGAGLDLEVAPDHHLGDPGVYVLDGERAWVNWQRLGHEEVMTRLVGSGAPDSTPSSPTTPWSRRPPPGCWGSRWGRTPGPGTWRPPSSGEKAAASAAAIGGGARSGRGRSAR